MPEKHILVVEDDPDGQELLAETLMHLGYTVDTADDGAEASRLLFDSDILFDAAVLDLALPEKDGWQLLSEILADAATQSMPCIAVTAFHTSKLREDALKAGFTAYFPKPIDSTSLSRELERIIG